MEAASERHAFPLHIRTHFAGHSLRIFELRLRLLEPRCRRDARLLPLLREAARALLKVRLLLRAAAVAEVLLLQIGAKYEVYRSLKKFVRANAATRIEAVYRGYLGRKRARAERRMAAPSSAMVSHHRPQPFVGSSYGQVCACVRA